MRRAACIFIQLLLMLGYIRADDEAPSSFRDYKLIRINPETEDNLTYLKSLYEGSSPYQLDFWQPPTQIGALVDLAVPPNDAPIFVKDLDSKNINYFIAINDLQQAIQNERSPSAFYHPEAGGFAYDKYNSLEDIHSEMKRLKREKPDMITLIDIGQSHENRTLLVIKVSGKRAPLGGKMSFWLDAGIHAREWIAPATAMYILRELIHGYENDPAIQAILDSIDFYILPVVNPDGYEYSRTKNRMWRKNRRPATCKRQHFHTLCCGGVDLNRNFDWFWASSGSSSDPCHETYHGPNAFSEPESVAIRDFLEENKPEAFITLHSYSQMWLIPFGHRKRSYPQDYQTALRPLALRATKAIYEMYGTKYQVGTGADLMYEASGGSHDWAKGSLKVPYSFLIELRPKNTLMGYGFLLPEREIAATGLETFEAIKVVADEIVGQFVQPQIRSRLSSTTASSILASTATTFAQTTTGPIFVGETKHFRLVNVQATTTLPTPGPESTTGTLQSAESTISSNGEELTVTQTSTTSATTENPSTTTIGAVITTQPSETSSTGTSSTTSVPSTSSPESTVTSNSTVEVSSSSPSEQALEMAGNMIRRFKPAVPETTDGESVQQNIRCFDYGSYCRLWGILRLCDRESVSKLCSKTCSPTCRL